MSTEVHFIPTYNIEIRLTDLIRQGHTVQHLVKYYNSKTGFSGYIVITLKPEPTGGF